MTQRDRTPSRERRIRRHAVLGVLAALAAQTALPALHIAQTARPEHAAAFASAEGSRVELADSFGARPAHDSATCPVCQSLVRTNVAVQTAACGQPGAWQRPTPHARPQPAPARVALEGHPARGPPAAPFSSV